MALNDVASWLAGGLCLVLVIDQVEVVVKEKEGRLQEAGKKEKVDNVENEEKKAFKKKLMIAA